MSILKRVLSLFRRPEPETWRRLSQPAEVTPSYPVNSQQLRMAIRNVRRFVRLVRKHPSDLVVWSRAEERFQDLEALVFFNWARLIPAVAGLRVSWEMIGETQKLGHETRTIELCDGLCEQIEAVLNSKEAFGRAQPEEQETQMISSD